MIASLLGLAGLYLDLHAEFFAAAQVLIYAGAVMILFLFVIAIIASAREPAEPDTSSGPVRSAALASAGLLAVLGLLVIGSVRGWAAPEIAAAWGSVADFGERLLVHHVFPFELTAFVLMAAVVGVAVLVGRRG